MKETQQKIISSLVQDYLEVILDNFQDGIYIADKEANTVYLNHSYELISGLPKSEVFGKNMRDLVARGVISQSGTLEVLETGKSITIEQGFRTGKRAIITSTPIYDEHGDDPQIIMVVTTVRETTEVYSIRRELLRKEQQNRQYLAELEQIRREMDGDVELVAVDDRTVTLMRLIERISLLDSPVLLGGENGVGKESYAGFIHRHSRRSDCAFIRLNFSVIPEEEMQSYLFGSQEERDGGYQMGILESAEGGTVYIEELADMPAVVQGQLLSILKDGSCVLGDGIQHHLNVRILAGSRYSLETLRDRFTLSPEILDAFSVFSMEIPPLRERKDDIIPLLNFYLKQYNYKTGEEKSFSRESYAHLVEYSWPGNVRELRNLVERAAIVSARDEIEVPDLMIEEYPVAKMQEQEQNEQNRSDQRTEASGCAAQTRELTGNLDLKLEVAKLEADYMNQAFAQCGNIRDASEMLGMDASTFVRKRKRYEQLGLMENPKKKNS